MNEDIYTVKVEKMLYEGKALARIDSVPVFISGGCPEDILKIKITKKNKTYFNAEILEIVEKSKYRTAPFCTMHKVCGSCDWQHIEYEEQLRQKRNIVFETLKNITGIEYKINETIPSPKLKEYRCKVQYPVSQTKVSERLLSGYYKKNSHELVNIKYCPIQPEIINVINEDIKLKAQELKISGYDEKSHKGILRHIVYRISSDLKRILIVLVVNDEKIQKKIKELSEYIYEKYSETVGICINFNTQKNNVILGKKTLPVVGNNYYIEEMSGIKYKISANSFFQVNPYCAAKIFDELKNIILKNTKSAVILDAYSGVSSIGIWLSSACLKVVCVEESKSASNDAVENVQLNNLSNVEVINGDAGVIFNTFIKEGRKFDISVIDPPRKGSTKDAIENLVKMTANYIIYVSCNPATLARDIKIFCEKGFYPQLIQPVDMFPNTYHIETIVLLKRE